MSPRQSEHERLGRRYRKMRKVGVLGGLVNVMLAAIKVFFGWLAQSQSLIADGLHSLADAATNGAVILAAKFSNQAADADHPYGHARIETAATAGLGVILILTGLGIVFDAGQRLVNPDSLLRPTALALWIAALSILVNEGLYQYSKHQGKKLKSPILLANAWHHRSDSLSSVLVLVGVGGVLLGFAALDALAAVGVALMVIHIGWQQVWTSFAELVDEGLPADRVAAIHKAIDQIDGVYNAHCIRTRRMGNQAFVDLHIQVDPRISVSEGHQLAELVQDSILRAVDEVSDVTVHIDPEDNEIVRFDLPTREQVEAELMQRWAAFLPERAIEAMTLHYLDQRIGVDVVVSLDAMKTALSPQEFTMRLRRTVDDIDYLAHLKVYFSSEPPLQTGEALKAQPPQVSD